MSKEQILYHGSLYQIEQPQLGLGKPNNDYGPGFYCTAHHDLACEWASKSQGIDGFVNEYDLDMTDLKVLDLGKYTILHWMALLLRNRTFTLTTPISIQAKEYLLQNFSIDLSEYDVVKGYRADDSYFSFAEDFLNNAISLRHLSSAMHLGELGIQYVLVSQKAFDAIRFRQAKSVDNSIYFPQFTKRDLKARMSYKDSKVNLLLDPNELYVLDIIRGGIKDGDPRLS